MLFSGTLRNNLDPVEEHTDEQLWQALTTANLQTFVSGLPEGLQFGVSEGGENLRLDCYIHTHTLTLTHSLSHSLSQCWSEAVGLFSSCSSS